MDFWNGLQNSNSQLLLLLFSLQLYSLKIDRGSTASHTEKQVFYENVRQNCVLELMERSCMRIGPGVDNAYRCMP